MGATTRKWGEKVPEPRGRARLGQGGTGLPPSLHRPVPAKDERRRPGPSSAGPLQIPTEQRGSYRDAFHIALSLHASTFQLNLPKLPKALFACKGLRSKMLTYCLLSELNISLFSSHLKEVLEQYSKTVQTNKTFPFARERNPVYSVRGHILRSSQIWF